MKRPDTFTITTFWMDWSFVPVVLGGLWLTVRWALEDMSQASSLGTWGAVPPWVVAIPLFLAAVGWLAIGSGMLIKEEYWEFRLIRSGLIVWAFCSLAGAGLVLLGFRQEGGALGGAGPLDLIGLVLMCLIIVFPAWVDPSSGDQASRVGGVWFLLLAVSVGCLLAGLLVGFPYNFPRFPMAAGAFFLFGLGLTEIAFSKTSFPWYLRLFQLHLGREYHEQFPASSAWRIQGTAKVLVGIGAGVALVMA